MDIVKPGEVGPAWDEWAKNDAIKFITDDHSRSESEFFASGMVSVGQALTTLRVVTKSWAFLDGRILDLGCAIGRHSRHFKTIFKGGVVGVDTSARMIDLAKQKTKGIDFFVSKESVIPVDDNSVDIVHAFTVLQHNPRSNVIALLKEMHRVLKPGGVTCIQLPVVSDVNFVTYPATPNRTAKWHDAEFKAAINGLFKPLHIATDNHFGYHILEAVK